MTIKTKMKFIADASTDELIAYNAEIGRELSRCHPGSYAAKDWLRTRKLIDDELDRRKAILG